MVSDRLARLGRAEKLGYGVGDFGFNLYWTTLASFLAAFYTDVFGLTAAAAGTLLLVARVLDAFTDPIMGAIADRTQSRAGKFRPYLLWAAIPMGIAAVATFSTPDTNKLLWAYGTYSLMMLCYTVLSTPYSSLSGVLTASSQQRTQLISIRFFFAFSAGALVNQFTLPLVEQFGGGNAALGWQRTMAVYGAVACICFWVCYGSTRERVRAPKGQSSKPIQDIRHLVSNGPWLILFALALVIMLTITLRAGSAYYYFVYYLDRSDLLSSYLFWQMVAYGVGAVTTPLLTRYFEKARLLKCLLVIVGVLGILFAMVPKERIELIFTLNILISLALGPKSPITWSMYADTADFNEWRNGIRATAMTFSAATFAQKMGGALASASMLWILALLGYSANVAQSDASLQGIALLHTALPGLFALAAALLVGYYPLTGERLQKMQEDLVARDEQNSSS